MIVTGRVFCASQPRRARLQVVKAFSSQVESLGGSENATKQSIFKPSGITWRLGKCDPTKIQCVSGERM
jgi:hypothetical protein